MVDFAGVGLYFLDLFITWVKTIFIIPFQNMEMLWLLVPIWVTWFFAEFFQEKHGTSMGNAITNSVVVIWGSIDCTRQTFRLISEGTLNYGFDVYLRFLIILLVLVYGIIIVVLGLRGNRVIKYIGRVREVTYVFAMFVPVFYNAIPLTLTHVVSALLFMPIFYFTIELIDRYTPNPKAVVEDLEDSGKEDEGGLGSKGLGGDLGGSKGSDLGGGLDLGGFGKSSGGLGGTGGSGKDSGGLGDLGGKGGGLDDFKL